MFSYFPDNYGWSLSVLMALNMGGDISEIDEACTPLRPLAATGDSHEMAWFDRWGQMSRRLESLARADEAAGHRLTAGRKYLRSALYLLIAERQVVHKTQATQDAYSHAVGLFQAGYTLAGLNIERVEVPFGETSMPALLVHGQTTARVRPAMVHFAGLDVNKELIYLWRVYDLAARGVTVLICDQPGVGESVRFRGLYASFDTEHAGTACYEFLAGRPDVDPDRIGIIGVSLGGYYAPRVAAFEPRFSCCVLWGAIWSMPELFAWLDMQEHKAMSVPLDDQFRWIMGAKSVEEAHEQLQAWTLGEIMDRITCPILIAHGGNDRQAPVFVAQKTYDAAVSSRRRDLRVFGLDEGGAEHCHVDGITLGTDYMFDWIAEVLGAEQSNPKMPLIV